VKCDSTRTAHCHNDFWDIELKKMKFGSSTSQAMESVTIKLVSVRSFRKDSVFVPTLPTDILDLKHRITEVVMSVTRDMLVKVWGLRLTSAVWLMGTTLSVCKVCKKLGEILYPSVCVT
jgi:hypothetical protein